MKQLYHDRGLAIYAEQVGHMKLVSFTITTVNNVQARTVLTKAEAARVLDKLSEFVHGE